MCVSVMPEHYFPFVLSRTHTRPIYRRFLISAATFLPAPEPNVTTNLGAGEWRRAVDRAPCSALQYDVTPVVFDVRFWHFWHGVLPMLVFVFVFCWRSLRRPYAPPSPPPPSNVCNTDTQVGAGNGPCQWDELAAKEVRRRFSFLG